VRVEEGLVKDSAVEGEKHPSYKRRGSSFVESRDTFFSDGLKETLERAGEAGGVGRLQSNLDCIEWMTN